MTFQQEIAKSPSGLVKSIMIAAFDLNHKNRKQLLRIVHHAINIAQNRGYSYTDELLEYFKHQESHVPKTTAKLLNQLFEYISEDEFVQLAKATQVRQSAVPVE